jgi:hypothetical protein
MIKVGQVRLTKAMFGLACTVEACAGRCVVTTTARTCFAVLAASVLGMACSFHSNQGEPAVKTAPSVNQGCVNQGSDRRIAGSVICWAQRRLSWKSEREPRFVLLGRPERTSIGLAWPPYVVYNSSDGSGCWRMFRIGFRYDRAWRGYIFPTVAWKLLPRPLRY